MQTETIEYGKHFFTLLVRVPPKEARRATHRTDAQSPLPNGKTERDGCAPTHLALNRGGSAVEFDDRFHQR
jgi:hypothetical protein